MATAVAPEPKPPASVDQRPAVECSTLTITVADLITMPHLGISVRAGAGGLAARVSWAHVSELEDPTPWLEGGELIMTAGMAVPRGAARQKAYVDRLAARGVAAVAISQDLYAPADMTALLAEADRRSFPVLDVSIEVPFLVITRVVATANQAESQRRLVTHLQIFDSLRAASREGLEARALFDRLERLSGYRLFLGTPSGKELLPGVGAPPASSASLLPRPTGASPEIPGGYAVSVPVAGRTAGYLVALQTDGARGVGLSGVQHIATIAALQVANLDRERESLRRAGAETLAELLAGVLDPGVAQKRLDLAGFDVSKPAVLAVIRSRGAPLDDQGVARALIMSSLTHLLLFQRDLWLLTPADPGPAAALGAVEGTVAGVSAPFNPAESLVRPRRQATWALQRALDRGSTLAHFHEAEAALAWLPPDADSLNGLVDQVLGAVVRYEPPRGADLLRSLSVWLESERRTEAAARILGVHKHTLAYRLSRVESLTGRDLSRVRDLADVWLAMRALAIVAPNLLEGERTVGRRRRGKGLTGHLPDHDVGLPGH